MLILNQITTSTEKGDKVKNILIIEDDKTLNKGILLTLKQPDIEIKQAYNLEDAIQTLKNGNVDLILLDVNLPDGDGFDFCKNIKEKSDIPVIFLTACDLELDIVTGLELGADDYITKPFSLMVLRARVMAALRRSEKKKGQVEIFEIGDMVLDFGKLEYFKKNKKLTLSKTEQKLLKILANNKNQVLTREQLIDRVWSGEGEFVDENALTVNIKRLREKIEDDKSNPNYIKTIYGIGYIFDCGD
ncbi:response regulator transcription factor [Clostridioides mangenotii]|uniref:response regulator transcription factor n=1 Tax=Metaclostridioides mangenotii TaxID=1540 RepID=UPI001C129104|nr:response regulator transcription factor [Clostridioides mangenotii]MBU5306954.1 response regulator transcription factor [Clostridioides mangenotii]MCR1955882.1 response regulator transcription factor [Clostridioides mangenotii]